MALRWTGALLRSAATERSNFAANRGRSGAQAGFAAALERKPNAVLTIDSDGQHDPGSPPAILAALGASHIAIGTRDLTGERCRSTTGRKLSFQRCNPPRSGGAVHDSRQAFARYARGSREIRQPVTATNTRPLHHPRRSAGYDYNVPLSTIYGPRSYFREFPMQCA